MTVLPVVPLPAAPWIIGALAILTAAFGLRGFKRLQATTLAAPCLWVALSASCLAFGALLESRLTGISHSAARFAIATTTLCPLMAVLGAKRPQDRGWQWVVATLWIVLVWPAAQAVVLPAGVRVELFVAWKIFLWGLIGIGLLNYLPTSHWRSTILVALGQILLLREHLALPISESPQTSQLVATLSFLTAAALASRGRATQQPPTNELTPLSSLTFRWFRFRNNYGAFWALRVLGRINQSAELRDWPVQLDWSGFTKTGEKDPTAEQLIEIEQTLDSMLRRFLEDK